MTEFDRMVLNVWEDRIRDQVQQMIGATLGHALAELNGLKDKVGEMERKLKGNVNFMEVPPFPVVQEAEETVDFRNFTGGD